MDNLEKAEKVSTGRRALVGRMVRYHLGQYMDGHVGHLCYLNTDGDWVVRNAADGKQYVLRMQPETEPIPERRAKWFFSNQTELSTYLREGRIAVGPLSAKYPNYANLPGVARKPAPAPKPASSGDLVKDSVNKALKDLKGGTQ